MLLRACLLLVLVVGCVDRGPGPQGKKIEASYIRNNLLSELPAELLASIERVDVELGGKVVYVGTRLQYPDNKDPTIPLPPGHKILVHHYWQVKEPIGRGWRIFRLLRGASGSADFMNLGPTDMEIGHPLHAWKPGQIIQDTQEIVLRPDWRSPIATLHVGLIADGGHQLGDRMAASGPHVTDRAILARTIQIDLTKAPPPPGTVYVPRAAGPIVIDGVVTEPGWANAVTSPELVTADGSPDPVGKAIAKMTWDDANLYVFVQITDKDIYSQYKQQDDPLWKQDCIELFIDADGNRRGYIELQVNPNNATFDSFFATTRAQPGDEAWDSGMVTAVKVRGTADKAGDADQGWDVEIAIPLAAVKGTDPNMRVNLPPQIGDRWRLNVVRVDYRSSGGSPAVSSWNRIGYGDFHALDRMLTVVFADGSGSITPPTGDEAAGDEAGTGDGAAETGSAAGVPGSSAAGAPSATGEPPRATPQVAPPRVTPRVAPPQVTPHGGGSAPRAGSAGSTGTSQTP